MKQRNETSFRKNTENAGKTEILSGPADSTVYYTEYQFLLLFMVCQCLLAQVQLFNALVFMPFEVMGHIVLTLSVCP